LSCDITEKSAVKSPAAICGTAADALPAGVLELESELHAARIALSTRTTVPAARLLSLMVIDASLPPETDGRPHPWLLMVAALVA
jgi:hypothetical protein